MQEALTQPADEAGVGLPDDAELRDPPKNAQRPHAGLQNRPREDEPHFSDPAELARIREQYFAHLRAASVCGATVVGTETGAPNAQYKLDRNTHTDGALNVFLHNLEPVVRYAEDCGVSLAIEPVWNHIVYSADRAVTVLRSLASPRLRIILDPVNLLCLENADEREYIFAEATDKLGEWIEVLHLKDFVRREGKLVSVAAGTGEMDYEGILRFMKQNKPDIQATFENTVNENAVSSRELIEKIYKGI